MAGLESVSQALDALTVSWIGHAERSADDPAQVERLVANGIGLEACPGSNFALGFNDNPRDHPRDHPLNGLREAGAHVTLGSDDPTFFGTTIGAE